MTEKIDSNDSEYCKNELSQDESKDLNSYNKTPINDELRSMLLKEADDFESYAIEAFKNGKISLDQYHQMSLLAMMCLRGEAEPIYGQNQALAFALGLTRVCGNEIKLGIEHNDLEFCFDALRTGNVSLGVAKRIEIDQELMKQKAKKAAHARHSQNDAYKQLVWDYYKQDMHLFKSLDQAAEKISSKPNIPFAFRTVRRWIDEFLKLQKKLPSA
ncbi:hypothetical protein [Methylobacter sp.]|uniref:hypothetical protein n=1 Tax=Methylobacter sp. TaxID=2051955 RepID=UPI003DA1FBB4